MSNHDWFACCRGCWWGGEWAVEWEAHNESADHAAQCGGPIAVWSEGADNTVIGGKKPAWATRP